MRGMPPRGRTFLRGNPLDPPRAGMMANVWGIVESCKVFTPAWMVERFHIQGIECGFLTASIPGIMLS